MIGVAAAKLKAQEQAEHSGTVVPRSCQWDFQGPPNDGTHFPYDSHTTPIRIPEDMGRVWE